MKKLTEKQAAKRAALFEKYGLKRYKKGRKLWAIFFKPQGDKLTSEIVSVEVVKNWGRGEYEVKRLDTNENELSSEARMYTRRYNAIAGLVAHAHDLLGKHTKDFVKKYM